MAVQRQHDVKAFSDQPQAQAAKITDLKAQNRILSSQHSVDSQQNTDLSSQIASLRSPVNNLTTQISSLKAKLIQLRSRKPMPDLTGASLVSAKGDVNRAGWTLVIRRKASSQTPGTIIEQTPSAGKIVISGATLTLVVAKPFPVGPAPAPTPLTVNPRSCTLGYSPCLPPASDYDCIGGSGDGG